MKKKVVMFEEGLRKQAKELGIEKEFDIIVEQLQKGELLGDEMDLADFKTRIPCVKCDSMNIKWVLDKNSGEVYFNCNECGDHGWMYESEYNDILKKMEDEDE